MADTMTCPECGKEITSEEDVDTRHDVPEMEVDDDGIHLFENRDLFLCKNCKNPLGIRRRGEREE